MISLKKFVLVLMCGLVSGGTKLKSYGNGAAIVGVPGAAAATATAAASSNVEKRCSPCVSIGRDRDYERLYDSNDSHGPYYDRIRPRFRDDEQLFGGGVNGGSAATVSTAAGGASASDDDFWDYKKLSSPSYHRKVANGGGGHHQQYRQQPQQTHHNNNNNGPYYEPNDRRNPQSNRLRFPTATPDDYYDSPNAAGPGYRGNGYDNLNEHQQSLLGPSHGHGPGPGSSHGILAQNDHAKNSNFDHRKYRYKNNHNSNNYIGDSNGGAGGYDDYRRGHERNFINHKSQSQPLPPPLPPPQSAPPAQPVGFYDFNERQPYQKGYDEWNNFEHKNGNGPGFGSFSNRHRDLPVYGVDCVNTAAGSNSVGVGSSDGDDHSNGGGGGGYRSKFFAPRLQSQQQPQQISSHHFGADKGGGSGGGGGGDHAKGSNGNGATAAATIATSYLHDRNNSLVSETNHIQTKTTTATSSSSI